MAPNGVWLITILDKEMNNADTYKEERTRGLPRVMSTCTAYSPRSEKTNKALEETNTSVLDSRIARKYTSVL